MNFVRLSVVLLLLGLVGCGRYSSSQKALYYCAERAKKTRVRQSNTSEQDIGSGFEYLYTLGCGYKKKAGGDIAENVRLAKEGVIPQQVVGWRFDRGTFMGNDWKAVKHYHYQ